jgi:HD-like signal output (HDOD) protein
VSTQDLQNTLERLEALPTLPSVLTQVLATVHDPDTSALDLGRLIAADQSLSAAVLRLVNSAYYSYYRQIDTVTQAIVILGFNEVCKVALAATAFKAVPASESGYDRRQLWRHSLASGMAAERTARAAGWPPAGGYFIAGLLNDIGKVALDWLWPDQFAQAVVTAHGAQRPLPEVEREIFGADHCVVGAALATHWNLPESVVESIRWHFEPDSARKDAALAHLAVVADYIAFTADAGDSAESSGPVLPAKSQSAVGVTDSQMDQIVAYIMSSEERIDAFLGNMV